AEPNPDLLANVIRRFYHTAAGFEAGNRLADYWTNHGCDELALGWWRRALEEPAHHDRVQPVHRVQAACCCQRLGRLAAAREISEQLSGAETVVIGGRALSTDSLQDQLLRSGGTALAGAGSRASTAQLNRNAAGHGSPPALSRPMWRAILAGEQSRHIDIL